MRPHVRTYAIALFMLAAGLATSPAYAGTITQPNACFYSVNEEFRNQAVVLSGVGSPVGAPAGTVATLSGASISAQLPPSLPMQGYEGGIFHSGYNEVPSKVWIAIAASNATPATQVRELSVIASTTITVQGGEGSEFVSGTPIVVTIPIPDTTWTVAADGPVTFAQAPAGSLPDLPVGLDDKVIAVKGSIVVKPSLGGLRFVMDCQPGSTAAPNKVATPLAATPFAQLEAAAPVPPPPPPPPPVKPAGKPRVASSKLKLVAGRVAITIACPAGTVACKGRVGVRSLAPLKLGSKRAILDLTASRAYVVPASRQRVFKIAITPAARRVMRARRSLGLRVTLKPSAGANASRVLTLSR
jgi:hypothetical protein